MILADLQALGGGPCDRPSSCWPRLIIEPSVGFYNLPNFSNFNLPPNTMNGILFGAGNGSINGTTPGGAHCDPNDSNACGNNAFRVGNGTGVYGLGSQRQIEFGLRFIF